MNVKLELWLAFGFFRGRHEERLISLNTWISLVGILLGVATLIVVMSIMNGFRADLISRILGVNGHLTVYPKGVDSLDDVDRLIQQMRQIPEIKQAVPFVEGQGLTVVGSANAGMVVRGYRAEDLQAVPLIGDRLRGGDITGVERRNQNGRYGALIGIRFAERNAMQVGDELTFLVPRGPATAFGTLPRQVPLYVTGVFDTGMYEYDQSFLYIGIDTALKLFSESSVTPSIEVRVASALDTRSAQTSIAAILPDGGRVLDWRAANESLVAALAVERRVMFLILTMIILIAAFNIISGQVMMAREKAGSIAILRSMGLSSGSILRVFFMSGAAIGLTGSFVGSCLGLAVAWNVEAIRQVVEGLLGTELFQAEIYYLTRLPARVDVEDVTAVIIVALTLSFLAALYPAWRAGRTDPARILRHE